VLVKKGKAYYLYEGDKRRGVRRAMGEELKSAWVWSQKHRRGELCAYHLQQINHINVSVLLCSIHPTGLSGPV
jgi:hypothetical protein